MECAHSRINAILSILTTFIQCVNNVTKQEKEGIKSGGKKEKCLFTYVTFWFWGIIKKKLKSIKESSVRSQGIHKVKMIIISYSYISNKQLRFGKLIEPNILLKKRKHEQAERYPCHQKRPNIVKIRTGFLEEIFRLFFRAMERYRGRHGWNKSEKERDDDSSV